nr:integrase, catalytic region, zinc finger, CCHC-type, peptidase aspartic, catalytic [Tanacetum cinerariifolium]
MQDKKPDLSFFHVFSALCYPTNDNDDLGKLDAKADIGIFVGYASAKKAFRIYNKRTQKIIETIHENVLVLVLVLMEYLLMEHPGQWKLTQEIWLKQHHSEQQLLELEKHQLMEESRWSQNPGQGCQTQ